MEGHRIPHAGATVWFTGLPSSGKSTIARLLAGMLRARGQAVEVLDGDELRATLTAGLGFSKADRLENVRRIGWMAQLLARNGVIVLAPVIAPYREARAVVRDQHTAAGTSYFEVHIATPLQVCSTRDVKGLYARQARGEISGLTGVDDPYEAPLAPDLRVDTSAYSPMESARIVYAALQQEFLAWL
jgi:adenylylsulfate kinase